MSLPKYQASQVYLTDLLQQCSSTHDYLQFIHQNIKLFSHNLTVQLQNRSQQTSTFKHKTIIALRAGIQQYLNTIKEECIDEIGRGIAGVLGEVGEIVAKVGWVREMNQEMVGVGEGEERKYGENVRNAAKEMQEINSRIREVEDQEFLLRCKMDALNDKSAIISHLKSLSLQKQSLTSRLTIARRRYTQNSTLLSHIQSFLLHDYDFAVKQYERQTKTMLEKINDLNDRLHNQARKSIYQRIQFEGGVRNPEERISEVEMLEEFLRNQEEGGIRGRESGVPLFRELVSRGEGEGVPNRQEYLEGEGNAVPERQSPPIPTATCKYVQSLHLPQPLEQHHQPKTVESVHLQSPNMSIEERIHHEHPLPVLLQAINLDQSRNEKSNSASKQKIPQREIDQKKECQQAEEINYQEKEEGGGVVGIEFEEVIIEEKCPEPIPAIQQVHQIQANKPEYDELKCNQHLGEVNIEEESPITEKPMTPETKKTSKRNKNKSKSKK